VPNLEPGPYKISITAPGFRVSQYSVELLARQTVRIDGAMYVSSQAAVVDVVDAAPVVNSDVSNIAETKTGRELNELPIAIQRS
jgi:hypothetical protein